MRYEKNMTFSIYSANSYRYLNSHQCSKNVHKEFFSIVRVKNKIDNRTLKNLFQNSTFPNLIEKSFFLDKISKYTVKPESKSM